ncbi:hypothetical protein [Pedobacter jamesrossensis]|uniref:Uncharacterized protein n=1 Tax=Pedobacter jamesrossensis TaxID=1908238 RepID=A0ABV8NI16_9SPHI
MKNIIYATLLLAAMLAFGCYNNANLNISVNDTDSEYTYTAVYPISKTDKLEAYLDRELNNELPLDEHIDTFVTLVNEEKFNLKASKGTLSIKFDKKNSSIAGYVKIKKLTDGISEILK